jgi:acetyl-CoA acetyltransferase
VVYRAIKARSGRRFGAAAMSPGPTSSHSGTTAMQWCYPYGVLTPAAWMSLNASRYMHTFGVTNADFGRAVVGLRGYAATNPAARFYGRPITLDDHQASRWIAEPSIRLFDCCQETDGAVAMVVTAADRAQDTPAPVRIAVAAAAALAESEVATDHYLPDLSVMTGTAALAGHLFKSVSRSDLDTAMIYDAFSPMLFMQLEALGLCGPGEAKDFVADGHLGPAGSLPCNTNGGLIGEGYIHGLNLTLEAVRQIRGTSPNQVPGARLVLVAAGRTGVILSS